MFGFYYRLFVSDAFGIIVCSDFIIKCSFPILQVLMAEPDDHYSAILLFLV